MKRLLLIAYHFPPYGGGSGVHRAAKFFKYLPDNAWRPHVLTTKPGAYESVDSSYVECERESSDVCRTFALDTQRHLSFKGRYLGWLAIPDRWVSWIATAVPAGLWLLYRKKVDLIVVTYPIATAVAIAVILQRLTGKPLVVDFRDSMTEDDYPREPLVRAIYRRIERAAMDRGRRFVFTTESARRMYLERYPHLSPAQCFVVSNGYDEEDFAKIKTPQSQKDKGGPVRLVHAGLIYPDERDPRPFFRALSRLKQEAAIDAEAVRVELRASGSETYYAGIIDELGISDIVVLVPALPHSEGLQDTASADALLLLQAANCNHQIPAKAYEYLRLGRPILALTAEEGDTARLLTDAEGATILDLADEGAIYQFFPEFIKSVRNGTHALPNPEKVSRYSRKSQTAAFALLLEGALAPQIAELETVHGSQSTR